MVGLVLAGGVAVIRQYLLWGLGLALAWPAAGYEGPRPRFIEVTLTWRDAATGQEQSSPGQLWFHDLPVRNEAGKVTGFGKPGYYDGIKWFVPQKPGEIWLARAPGNTNAHVLVLHDYCGEREVELAFGRVEVLRTADAKLNKLMEENVTAMTATKPDSGAGKDVDLGDLDPDAKMVVGTAETPGNPGAAAAAVRFATPKDIGLKEIPVGAITKIVFGAAADGIKREANGGRFLQYSREAKGDNGRVQVTAATFFGGPAGDERFVYGGFLPDDSVVLAGNFHDLSFVPPAVVRVVGTDPAADAYPPVEREDAKRKRSVTEYPRRTVALVRYAPGLAELREVLRLPWGTGTAHTFVAGPDQALYVSGWVGPHFESFAKEIQAAATVEFPEALRPDAKGRKREPGPDGFVVKIAPDRRGIAWVVRFRHATANIFPQPNGQVLARRGDALFYIAADGAVTPGPKLDITGSNMAVDSRTGEMYFGGSYRSATGLEPYVNPYLYKVDAAGRQVWTAYGWTGPIVGVDQHRLVADSSVTSVRVAEDGRLTLTAWSDGGNTVLGQQPYDLRQGAKCGGFCSSTWGATGGLTVRIAHLIQMNPATMEVPSFTRYIGYLPTSDIPTLINIYDTYPLPNGEVAVTGGGWTGFVESHDAWTKSWWAERQTNEHALAKGGPFFTLFTPDFNKVRLATITPGASGLHLAGKGPWVLLYGGATDLKAGEVDRPWSRKFPTITRHAVQPKNGGGLDAYVMLVNTQGEPAGEAK